LKITSAPLINPEPPSPATALPTMSITEELAAPQMTDPSSKRTRQAMNDHYAMSRTYQLHHLHSYVPAITYFRVQLGVHFTCEGL